jgi:hypothetical protein
VGHLLESLDEVSEEKMVQISIVTFNDLQCVINRNILWLFERHKPSQTEHHNINKGNGCDSGKHSEQRV